MVDAVTLSMRVGNCDGRSIARMVLFYERFMVMVMVDFPSDVHHGWIFCAEFVRSSVTVVRPSPQRAKNNAFVLRVRIFFHGFWLLIT